LRGQFVMLALALILTFRVATSSTYASVIIEEHPEAKVYMAEIGSQDSRILGEHHKNSIKYVSRPLSSILADRI
jgi:hypothetical protein